MKGFRPSFWSWSFPCGIIVFSVYYLFRLYYLGFGLGSEYPVGWCFIAAIVIGGILPLALTFTFKTELRDYFLPRLIILLSAIAVIALAGEFRVLPRGGVILIYALDAAFTGVFFFSIQRTRFKEWIIIFLSTPAVYMMLYHVMLNKDIPGLIQLAD